MNLSQLNTAERGPKPQNIPLAARAYRSLRLKLLQYGRIVLPPSLDNAWHRQRIIATPPWASFTQIRKVYTQARYMTDRTGSSHTVDHIVPLNHPKVCGLHVHWNLQVMLRTDGAAKGNKWRSDWDE
jgi:hypothetical protein